MTTATAVQMKADSRPDPNKISPCRIFLVEDDADDRALAQRQLMDSLFIEKVVAFKDGKELIDHMHEQGFMNRSLMLYTPILIIVDLEMPRKNGLEVIREIKSDPFLQPIPLVIVTGTGSMEKIARAQELGASGIFKKPLERDMLNAFFEQAWKWPPPDLWR